VTDAERRKLILLAESRESALSATRVLQGLVIHLEQLKDTKALSTDDPLYAPTHIAQDLVSLLFEIRMRLDQLISEVPS